MGPRVLGDHRVGLVDQPIHAVVVADRPARDGPFQLCSGGGEDPIPAARTRFFVMCVSFSFAAAPVAPS
jgi:hypothetical protein